MLFKMNNIRVLFLVAMIWAMGCGTGQTTDFNANAGPGSVNLGVNISGLKKGLIYGKVRFYTTRQNLLKDKAFYVSSCQKMASVSNNSLKSIYFEIKGLPVGTDNAISISFYEDSACQKLEGKALRGGIQIIDNGKEDEPQYYIQFVEKQGFSAYPVPVADLGYKYCKEDSECVSKEHPTAYCDRDLCRYDNLFPLNNRAYVSFGYGVSLASGRIAVIPGFVKNTFTDGSVPAYMGFTSDNLILTGMDGVTNVFGEQAPDTPISGHAFAGVTTLPSGSILFAGGATKVPFQHKIVPDIYTIDAKDMPKYSQDVDGVNELLLVKSDGSMTTSVLGETGFFGSAAFVVGKSKSDFKLFITAGLSKDQNDQWGASKTVNVCTVGADDAISCPNTTTLHSERVMPAYTCIERSNGVCSKELLMGGTLNPTSPFADLCTMDGCKLVNLKEDKRTNNRLLLLAKAFTLNGHIYSVGGLTWYPGIKKDSIDGSPAIFEYTLKDGNISLKAPSLSSDVQKALRGIYQNIQVIDDNTVLISGGITPDYHNGKPPISNKAVLLSYGEKGLKAKVFTMNYRRFGHQTAIINQGPLKGAIVVIGGMSLDSTGDLVFLRHAEAILP